MECDSFQSKALTTYNTLILNKKHTIQTYVFLYVRIIFKAEDVSYNTTKQKVELIGLGGNTRATQFRKVNPLQ